MYSSDCWVCNIIVISWNTCVVLNTFDWMFRELGFSYSSDYYSGSVNYSRVGIHTCPGFICIPAGT